MKTQFGTVILIAALAGTCRAQQTSVVAIPAQTPAAATAQVPSTPPSDGKIRVYVSDSQSWTASGSWGASNGSGGGSSSAGSRPQTAEIIKTFNQRCPEVIVTSNKDKANYAVILDHEGGKSALAHRNKIVVFNRDGDAIFTDSTRSLGNSVKDACAAIMKSEHK
jgi:hypothetical protein